MHLIFYFSKQSTSEQYDNHIKYTHEKQLEKAFSRVPGVGIAAWKLHKSPEQIHNLYKTENTYTTDIVAATVIPIAAGNAGVSTGASDIRFLLRYFIPQYDEKSANTKRNTTLLTVKKLISANIFFITEAKQHPQSTAAPLSVQPAEMQLLFR